MKHVNKLIPRRNRGFTLIELLVVIAIIGTLASVVLASLGQARTKANDAKRLSDLKQLQTALEIYYSDNGRYPPLSSGSVVANITGLAPKYIATLPEDPTRTGTSGYRYHSSNYTIGYTLLVNLETDAVGWCRPSAVPPGNTGWDATYPPC